MIVRNFTAMQKNVLKIIIHRAAADVFDFLLNPENSPKWLDGFVEERTNELPVKLGTVFENRGDANPDDPNDVLWNRYTVSHYDYGREFEFNGNNYKVRYVLKPLGNGADFATEMTITEWTLDGGDLPDPMTIAPFEKLKRLMEE